ncbi:DUF1648 domain-containing protein [Sporosarcina limicola]|uniref:Membrane protein n=1 Tax=Sporosarcina limicola TaxID=34101 RepID=A0A927MHQ3_9BACL|nr:DUF5808 domain-containing protein [Sporosarcina limicola]MBE1554828.1 putative membrane protein [Sporosarcina limicola]
MYSTTLTVIAVLLGAVNVLLPMLFTMSEDLFVLISLVILHVLISSSFMLYFTFHLKMRALRNKEDWYDKLRQVHVMDLSLRKQDNSLPSIFLGIPIIITLALITYTYMNYDTIPDVFPTHWGITGEPDAWSEKSILSVIMLPIVLLGIQVMMLCMSVAMKGSRMKLNVNKKAQSAKRVLDMRKYSSWYFALISYSVTILFVFLHHMTMLRQDMDITYFWIMLVCSIGVTLGGAILFMMKTRNIQENFTEQVQSNVTDIDEDQYWKAGIFYFNENDPSILVEKRSGVGWTLNFGNKWSYLIVFIPLAPIIFIFFI